MTGAFSFPLSPPRGRILLALVRRDWEMARSYRAAFLLDLLFGFVNLAVFFFISRTFTDVGTQGLSGAPSYFAFAAVGIALTVVIGAASSGLALRLREEQMMGTLEALVAQPVAPAEIALGIAGFPFLFAMVRAALYLGLSVALLGLEIAGADWLGVLVILALTGMALSALGVLLGALVLLIKRAHALAGVVTFGMALVSGALFPVSVLPRWLEIPGEGVPTRFAFDGLRAALFRGGGWEGDALALSVFTVVGLPLAVIAFALALDLVRRRGGLGQY